VVINPPKVAVTLGKMSERLTRQMREEIEERFAAYKEKYITELDTEHELFMEKYPRLASAFTFYRDLFRKIDKRVENTRVVVKPYAFLVEAAGTKKTRVFPDRQKITLIQHYGDQLEEKGYTMLKGRRFVPENVFFHELLHVLCNYRPDLFGNDILSGIPCGKIDMFPELTVENPPKTSEGILKRIDEINSREV